MTPVRDKPEPPLSDAGLWQRTYEPPNYDVLASVLTEIPPTKPPVTITEDKPK